MKFKITTKFIVILVTVVVVAAAVLGFVLTKVM
jgi:hypothetical protein